jgi:hypothetical protein
MWDERSTTQDIECCKETIYVASCNVVQKNIKMDLPIQKAEQIQQHYHRDDEKIKLSDKFGLRHRIHLSQLLIASE